MQRVCLGVMVVLVGCSDGGDPDVVVACFRTVSDAPETGETTAGFSVEQAEAALPVFQAVQVSGGGESFLLNVSFAADQASAWRVATLREDAAVGCSPEALLDARVPVVFQAQDLGFSASGAAVAQVYDEGGLFTVWSVEAVPGAPSEAFDAAVLAAAQTANPAVVEVEAWTLTVGGAASGGSAAVDVEVTTTSGRQSLAAVMTGTWGGGATDLLWPDSAGTP